MSRDHQNLLTNLTKLDESLLDIHSRHQRATKARVYNRDIETPSQQANRIIKETKEISGVETKIEELTGEAEELRILILYTQQKRDEEKREKEEEQEKARLEKELKEKRGKYTEMVWKFQDCAEALVDARWVAFQERERGEAGVCRCEGRCGCSPEREYLSMQGVFDDAQGRALRAEREMVRTWLLLEIADEALGVVEEKARVAWGWVRDLK